MRSITLHLLYATNRPKCLLWIFALPAVLGGRCCSLLLEMSEVRLAKDTVSEGHPKRTYTD